MTALHWAAYRDDLEMAQMLLYGRAKQRVTLRINAMTPLFFACQNGNASMIELLLKAGGRQRDAQNRRDSADVRGERGNAAAMKLLLDQAQIRCSRKRPRRNAIDVCGRRQSRRSHQDVLMQHGADSSHRKSSTLRPATMPRARGARGAQPAQAPAAPLRHG